MVSNEGEEGRFAAATGREGSRTEETTSSHANVFVERGSGQFVERIKQGEKIYIFYEAEDDSVLNYYASTLFVVGRERTEGREQIEANREETALKIL